MASTGTTCRGGGISMMSNSAATSSRGRQSLRGGIGKFRSILPSTLLADATSNTGLPGGTQRLLCTWSGRADSRLAQLRDRSVERADDLRRRRVELRRHGAGRRRCSSRNYSPERAGARTRLDEDDRVETYISIDATYSLNLHQPGTVDLNFARNAAFHAGRRGESSGVREPDEHRAGDGHRVSTIEARTTTAYGRVTERVSDLRGDARQISVYAIPNMPFRWGIVILGYTFADARTQLRGFDAEHRGRSARRPNGRPSPSRRRHQFIVAVRTFLVRRQRSAFDLGLRTSSGLRFTPTVAGDINGDGCSNDRAFVFDPSTRARHLASPADCATLLATGPSAARDCLSGQLGRIAGRNSCVGPWFTTMNAQLSR